MTQFLSASIKPPQLFFHALQTNVQTSMKGSKLALQMFWWTLTAGLVTCPRGSPMTENNQHFSQLNICNKLTQNTSLVINIFLAGHQQQSLFEHTWTRNSAVVSLLILPLINVQHSECCVFLFYNVWVNVSFTLISVFSHRLQGTGCYEQAHLLL